MRAKIPLSLCKQSVSFRFNPITVRRLKDHMLPMRAPARRLAERYIEEGIRQDEHPSYLEIPVEKLEVAARYYGEYTDEVDGLIELLDTYLAPLEGRGRLGPKLRETLRVYFSAGESTSVAAKDLGVRCHTVRQRILAIEEILEQPLHACNAELQVALRLDELSQE